MQVTVGTETQAACVQCGCQASTPRRNLCGAVPGAWCVWRARDTIWLERWSASETSWDWDEALWMLFHGPLVAGASSA